MENKEQFQRFKRTRQVYMSPRARATEESPESIKFKSQQGYSSVCGSFRSSPSIGSLDANSERSNDFSPKVENRISDLQKMFENEKKKRELEYNQLLSIVSGFQGSSKEIHSVKIVPNFEYGELEFPMTPRVKQRRRVCNNYEKETEKIKRSENRKVEEQEFSEKRDESFDNEGNRSFSILHTPLIPGIEILLHQINRECDKHNTSIQKIQEEIFAIRLEMSKTKHILFPKVQQVPVEVQKFVKDECRNMKNSLKNHISDLIENTNLRHCEEKRKCEMNEVYSKLANISQFFAAEVKEQEQITSKQIQQMKEEMELQISNKFQSFSQNILQETSKASVQICNDLTKEIHTEKGRIDEIEEENKVIFEAFEKTIENMQENLYRIRNEGHIYERIKHEVIAFVESESEIINKQNLQKNNHFNEDLLQQIKNLQLRIERMEEEKCSSSLPSFSQMVKQGSLHTQETDSQLKSPQSMEQSEVLDFSFDGTGKIEALAQQTPLTEKQKEEVLEMIGENCAFLESRSCTIEDSVGEVIEVLNGLVEKLNKLM